MLDLEPPEDVGSPRNDARNGIVRTSDWNTSIPMAVFHSCNTSQAVHEMHTAYKQQPDSQGTKHKAGSDRSQRGYHRLLNPAPYNHPINRDPTAITSTCVNAHPTGGP